MRAAKELGAKVRFGIVDVDESKDLANRFKVYQLPVLYYYKAGYGKTDGHALPYTGGRSQRIFNNFGTQLYDDYLKNLDSTTTREQ